MTVREITQTAVTCCIELRCSLLSVVKETLSPLQQYNDGVCTCPSAVLHLLSLHTTPAAALAATISTACDRHLVRVQSLSARSCIHAHTSTKLECESVESFLFTTPLLRREPGSSNDPYLTHNFQCFVIACECTTMHTPMLSQLA